MRVRARIAYDGTDYKGFQRQANVPTVQATLESALLKITNGRIGVLAAGRTDAGVHAVGQIVAFDTVWWHGLDSLRRALNAVLPADIAVQEVEATSSDFHPRFDANSRRYRYLIHNAPVRLPLARRYSLQLSGSLNIVAMEEAANGLVGEHDFATFGQPTQGSVTVRRVLAAAWDERLPWLAFEIEANAFLYRMVRSIVGTLLLVGRGDMSVGEFIDVLISRDRGLAGVTAPPQGLCLMEVKY